MNHAIPEPAQFTRTLTLVHCQLIDTEGVIQQKCHPVEALRKTYNKAICLEEKVQTDGRVREEEAASPTVRLYYRLCCVPPEAQCPWYRCWDFMCG